ncbi:tetratricopeptide repeat protein, partial [Mesorhizobium sp. LNJC395A00]|uniref:tetratricopeptide repeat protein n=2 Tax=unclassified Mesorhizobium TaxID=325217 RepID=UPI0004CF8B7A
MWSFIRTMSLAALVVATGDRAVAQKEPTKEFVPGQIIVGFKSPSDAETAVKELQTAQASGDVLRSSDGAEPSIVKVERLDATSARAQSPLPEQNEQIVLEQQLDDLLAAQDLQSALPLAERIVSVAEENSGTGSEPYGRAIFNLAGLYGLNNLEKATSLFIQSVEIFEKSIPERPSEFFVVLLPAMDFLMQEAGRDDLARPILERISVVYERRDEVLLEQRTAVYRRLAYIYIKSGDQHALAKTSRRVKELRALHEKLVAMLDQEQALFQESVGQNQFARALLSARSLAGIARRLYGISSEQYVRAISNVGAIHERMLDYNDAFVWIERALNVARQGQLANSHVHADLLDNSARLLLQRLRYSEAEEMYRQEYDVSRILDGPNHPNTARVLSDLGQVLLQQGKVGAAIEMHSKALDFYENALGPDHPLVGFVLNNLGQDLRFYGRFRESEERLKRSIDILRAARGPTHNETVTAMRNLGTLYISQGSFEEAAALFQSAIDTKGRANGPSDFDHALAWMGLGEAQVARGNDEKALAAFTRALEIYDRQGLDLNINSAAARVSIARIHFRNGDLERAERLVRQSLQEFEAHLGPNHLNVADALEDLGNILRAGRRYEEADAAYQRCLTIRSDAFGLVNPRTASILHRQAAVAFELAQIDRALVLSGRAVDIVKQLIRLNYDKRQGRAAYDNDMLADVFHTHLDVLWAAATSGKLDWDNASRFGLEVAELAGRWASARAIAQMSERFTSNEPGAAAAVRRWQDLVAQSTALDHALVTEWNQGGKQRSQREAYLRAAIRETEVAISAAFEVLTHQFPQSADIINAVAPLASEDVQGMLGPQEALVLLLVTPAATPTPEETFIWVVTKEKSTWFRSKLGELGLSERVTALRCGLDNGEWEDEAKAKRCRELL